ncbi:MAG: hypothetical protein HYX76_08005 [Acidobacteria bacterium]|nr:hypothetical protein [Acidobacteriota bacterium]
MAKQGIPKWALAGAAVVVLAGIAALVVWVTRGDRLGTRGADLIEAFTTAEKRSNQPPDTAFAIQTVTISGESKRAIYAHPTSRIIYRLTVPRDAWLETWIAVKPEAWTQPGDGVLFRVGVSDKRTYEELLNVHVNPAAQSGDRRWIPVNLDLSPYSNQNVELIFNTNVGLPESKPDGSNDFAVWGQPRVYIR